MRAIEPEVRDIPEQRERPSRRTDGPLVVIFNPEARAAKAGEIAAETLAEAFHAHGVETRLAPCESEERSAEVVAEVVAEAVRADARAVIAVGGDGTVHAIVRALVEAGRQSDGGTSGEATALGIVPLGTMNNIACALCIPEDLDGAIDVIAAGDTRPLDLGVADGQPFVEVAGAGLMADLFPIMEAVKGRPWMIPAALWRAGAASCPAISPSRRRSSGGAPPHATSSSRRWRSRASRRGARSACSCRRRSSGGRSCGWRRSSCCSAAARTRSIS